MNLIKLSEKSQFSTLPTKEETLLQRALDYARLGWRVLPLHSPTGDGCSCGKANCESLAKHPRTLHGLKDATTDETQIRLWWTQWPDANIGIATGKASGLVILDVDPRTGGDESLRKLETKHEKPPKTVESLTGGGGQHFFFQHPGGYIKSKSIAPGLDIKADGGYIVAPGSLHISNRRYEWEVSSHADETPIAPFPKWLNDLTEDTSKKDWKKIVQGIQEGQRNATAASMAGKLLAGFKPQDWESVAWPLLQAWNEKNRPPLAESELRSTFDSIAKREAGKQSTNIVISDAKPLVFPEQAYIGVAADFANLYAEHTEAPKSFYYMAFLTYLGATIAADVTLNSAIHPQPRLYLVLLGKSADTRKSTALRLTDQFFQEALISIPVLHGAGSAEGLAEAFSKQENGQKILVLHYDELKAFVDKARIEGSVLLPTVTTLFERNHYQNAVRNKNIEISNAHLSLVSACTPETYASMFDSRFFAIGFLNRLFLVLGEGKRRFHLPPPIPDEQKNQIAGKLKILLQDLRAVAYGVEGILKLRLSPQANEALRAWYLNREESDFSKRLDTYAHRLLILFAVLKLEFGEISEETVHQVTALCDYELEARRECEPVEAANKVAEMEEKIRRALLRGPLKKRDLLRKVHAHRDGLWVFDHAVDRLCKHEEVLLDIKTKTYLLLKGEKEI